MSGRDEAKRHLDAMRKVREVVRNVSKEQIYLALQYYEMDVTKTIQAFVEDGAKSALLAWERVDTKKEKKNTAGNKKVEETKKSGEEKKVEVKNAKSKINVNNLVVSGDNVSNAVSSLSKEIASVDIAQSSLVDDQLKPNGSPTDHRILNDSLPLAEDVKKYKKSKKKRKNKRAESNSTVNANDNPRNAVDDKGSVLSKKSIDSMQEQVLRYASVIMQQVTLDQQTVRDVFREMRELLNNREEHLIAELSRIKEHASRMQPRFQSVIESVLDRCGRIDAMSEREQCDVLYELERHIRDNSQIENQCTKTPNFSYNSKEMKTFVDNFGSVVKVELNNAQTTSLLSSSVSAVSTIMRNATSNSSLLSSLGEDSGIYQSSPGSKGGTSVENIDGMKSMISVSNGLISMSSDGLSAEQLDQISKDLHESLIAQGIDPSVLSSVTGKTLMPPRRRRMAKGRENRVAHRPVGQSLKMPELSILQA